MIRAYRAIPPGTLTVLAFHVHNHRSPLMPQAHNQSFPVAHPAFLPCAQLAGPVAVFAGDQHKRLMVVFAVIHHGPPRRERPGNLAP
jgi:hypothetical protein